MYEAEGGGGGVVLGRGQGCVHRGHMRGVHRELICATALPAAAADFGVMEGGAEHAQPPARMGHLGGQTNDFLAVGGVDLSPAGLLPPAASMPAGLDATTEHPAVTGQVQGGLHPLISAPPLSTPNSSCPFRNAPPPPTPHRGTPRPRRRRAAPGARSWDPRVRTPRSAQSLPATSAAASARQAAPAPTSRA